MDQKTLHMLLIENMKAILGFSCSRLSNRNDAEDLAGEIILEILKSTPRLQDDKKFYAFMWRIAENTYANFLRSRNKTTALELSSTTPCQRQSVQEEVVLREDIRLLYRELSFLSKQYRLATILYYVKSYPCSRIARELNTSTEMVKYYLFRARKLIRGGMVMDRILGEKSYDPCRFEIDFWGNAAGDPLEYQSFKLRKMRGNILLAAYYTPVTEQEIGMELGVSIPYLEDEIHLLLEKQYLIEKKGKYLANIPIFTTECTRDTEGRIAETVCIAAQAFIKSYDNAFDIHFSHKFDSESIGRWQAIMFCSHFSLNSVNKHIETVYGGLPKDGPYRLVNGAGASGFVWGRSFNSMGEQSAHNGLSGIYNGEKSLDGRGTVIAFNFTQIANGQQFMSHMIDPVVCMAAGCYTYLPDDFKVWAKSQSYMVNEQLNFVTYTDDEYQVISKLLSNSIEIFTGLNRQACDVAAKTCADHAPEHIKDAAEHVGAIVYQFNSLQLIVSELFRIGWLKDVDDTAKPAMCVIKH